LSGATGRVGTRRTRKRCSRQSPVASADGPSAPHPYPDRVMSSRAHGPSSHGRRRR
jgi:hypothetical protein